jgi:DMSO/TMAO reductase YedYZ molybdopterin-dependent catalytic subunit
MKPSSVYRICQLGAVILAAVHIATSLPAQTNPPALSVNGAVEQPLSLTLSDLQAMPRTKLKTREKDGSEATFEGVLLFEVVRRARPILSEHCCSNAVNTVVVIMADDGYQALFSLPELDPKFSSREILLADRRDGKPLDLRQGALQVITPDDKVKARWVRQVTRIAVLPVGDLRGAATNSLAR